MARYAVPQPSVIETDVRLLPHLLQVARRWGHAVTVMHVTDATLYGSCMTCGAALWGDRRTGAAHVHLALHHPCRC